MTAANGIAQDTVIINAHSLLILAASSTVTYQQQTVGS
jgi:hypothetical protein